MGENYKLCGRIFFATPRAFSVRRPELWGEGFAMANHEYNAYLGELASAAERLGGGSALDRPVRGALLAW